MLPFPLEQTSVVEDERRFRKLFCMASGVDWDHHDHHRLVLYPERRGSVSTTIVGVEGGAELVTVRLHRSTRCQGINYGDQISVIAVLVPAADAPVQSTRTADPPKNCGGVP
jgi:hypothetical protein